MPQDAYTLRYLCGELNNRFLGGKINRIVEPNNDLTVFTVYTGKRTEKLFIDVNPSAPRIGLCDDEPESPLTAPNFCMLLRKHLLSATIDDISLVGFDRIVKIELTPSSEFFDAVKKTLYIELMGRYSNIILTEKGRILGGNRGINCFDNGVRPLIVGKPYVFPPTGDKKLPYDDSLKNGFSAENLQNQITTLVMGIAPSTAAEIALKYNEKYKTFSSDSFYQFLNEFINEKEYSPCVIKENGVVKDICVYPYETVSGEIVPFENLLSADEYYFKERNGVKKFNALKDRLSSSVNAALKKANKRLSAIKSREKDAETCEENRIKGELILANIYMLKGGEESFSALNYYNGETLQIALDKTLTAAKNAERYYKKYNKQKRALEALLPQRENAEKEKDYLLSVADFITLAENISDLEGIKDELISVGILVDKNPVKKKPVSVQIGRTYAVEDFILKVGRNNAENDKIAFSAKPEDLWLHAKDYHSSHVIIESNNRAIPDKIIELAAEICAYYSKGRDGGKTEIVYTKRKNIKKPPKTKPGFVTYVDFKSVMVEPKIHAEFLKLK